MEELIARAEFLNAAVKSDVNYRIVKVDGHIIDYKGRSRLLTLEGLPSLP
jgi:hypothetical protein